MLRFSDRQYFYTGPVEAGVDSNEYRLDASYIDDLIAQRRYQEAIDYMKQFHFDDIFREQGWKAEISKVRDQYKQANYLYGDLPKDSPELQAVDFSSLILRPGGWALIDDKNKYKQQFTEIKRNLGNTSLGNATSLEVEFAPKKQSLWGIDALAADNDINIDKFYEYTGLSKEELTENGMAPREKDGRTVITFSKDSDLSNRILYGLGALLANEQGKYFNLIGYDSEGNRLDEDLDNIKNAFQTTESLPAVTQVGPDGKSSIFGENGKLHRGYTTKFRDWTGVSKNNLIDAANFLNFPTENYGTPNYRESLTNLYNSLSETSKVNQELVDDLNSKKELLNATYPTTIFGYLSNQVQTEFEMMNRGLLDRQQFNTNRKEYESNYAAQLAGLSESDYEFYSNWNEPEKGLKLTEGRDRHDLFNHMLAAYKANRVHIQVAESGGELGAYISIVPEEKKDLIHEKDNETIDIFIPGLWADVAQKRLDSNTTYKARKEVQDMELMGYEYKTNDGNTISVKAYDSKGKETSFKSSDSLNRQFYITDKQGNTYQIDKAEALTRIDKSMIMEDAVEGFMNKYSNLYGKITDMNAVETELRRNVTKAVNELYPNMIELSEADIFDNPVVKDKNGEIVINGIDDNTTADEELTWQAYYKIKEAFDIYSYVLNNLIYAKK